MRWPTDESGHRHWGTAIAVLALIVATGGAAGTWWNATRPKVTNVSNENTVLVSPTQAPIQPGDEDSTELCHPSSVGEDRMGWGPDRPMFLDGHAPPYLTLNSVANVEDIGDERNAVGVRRASEPPPEGGYVWSDRLEVEPGEAYYVRMVVHAIGPPGSTSDLTAKFNLPSCTGHRIGIYGLLTSDDVFPRELWDGATVWAREDFNIAYVPDSARFEADISPAVGFPLNAEEELLTSKGALIGASGPDGRMSSGQRGFVTFQFRPQFVK